jgi:hypothetical protein
MRSSEMKKGPQLDRTHSEARMTPGINGSALSARPRLSTVSIAMGPAPKTVYHPHNTIPNNWLSSGIWSN